MHSERFEQALGYAARLHADQKRKCGAPYFAHLLAVCSLALEHGADEDVAIAALLHDAIEDQGGQETACEIERRFGARVRAVVEACTDSDAIPKPPWRPRKEAFLKQLRAADDDALLVAASDKLHNARSTLRDLQANTDPADVWALFKGGRDGSIWYYRELVTIFSTRGPRQLERQLRRVVEQLAQY